MRWKGREKSENVEDRRGARPVGLALGGGGLLTIVIALVAMFLGADPRAFMGLVEQPQGQPAQRAQQAPGVDDEAKEFISVVLKDTENVWTQLFRQHVQGGGYQPPQLVLFSGTVRTACGMANAAMGPFYCPADQQVYIDPTFFDELKTTSQCAG